MLDSGEGGFEWRYWPGLLGVLAYGAPLVSTLLLMSAGYAESSGVLAVSSLLIVGGVLLAAAGPGLRRAGAGRVQVPASFGYTGGAIRDGERGRQKSIGSLQDTSSYEEELGSRYVH